MEEDQRFASTLVEVVIPDPPAIVKVALKRIEMTEGREVQRHRATIPSPASSSSARFRSRGKPRGVPPR